MTNYEVPESDWTGEWHDIVESFPDWAPELHSYGSDFHLIMRLCTYPEMEKVWEQLSEWGEEVMTSRDIPTKAKPLFEKSLMININTFAEQCIAENLGVATLTTPQRQKLINRVTGQAKALSKSLRELNAPKSISHYIDWEVRYEEMRLQRLEFLYSNFPKEKMRIEILHRLDRTHPEGHESDSDWDEDQMSKLQKDHEQLILYDLEAPSAASIYCVLNHIMTYQSTDLPEPIVKKAKGENAHRLFTVRLFARFLKYSLDRNPKSLDERKIIARLARTVLDDPEIGEDTVKDALRSYQL